MKTCTFTPGGWQPEDFLYASSATHSYRSTFVQQAECISNEVAEPHPGGEYISMVTRQTYGPGTVCEVLCAYEGDAAPLIVFGETPHALENGTLEYGDHLEAVLYKNGCNVWDIPLVDGKTKVAAVIKVQYPVPEATPVKLRVEFLPKALRITCHDRTVETPCPTQPERFHVGITACEGVCRFYEMKIG